MKRALCAAGLLLGQMPAQAYELQTLEVSHQGKAYHVQVQARLARKPERVFAVLTEFERASQLNPSIKSMVVMPEGDALRSVSHTDGCFAGFCRDIFHVQKLTVRRSAHGGRIDAITEPLEHSDFASGDNHILVQADGYGALFSLVSTSVPSFWLPPLIGPYAVQMRLREEALNTLSNLERLASE